MKIFTKASSVLALTLALGLLGPVTALAATTPQLGAAATYGILSSTYTNTVPGTTINGDVGFTTAPSVVPAGTHTNYGSGAPYPTAVIDSGSALSNLNGQACTFTFAPGAIDLATDATHGPVGVYTPGVYCATAMVPFISLGASGITLNGSGTYIFRINGSLVTAASSVVSLAGGANACDVFWTVVDNAIISTLGANSTFTGTLFDTTGLNIHTNATWTGRAFLINGIITTVVDDTITVPNGCTPPPPLPATLHVVKHVVNNNGGTAVASSFTLHIIGSGSMGSTDVAGSPAAGVESPGTSYTLAAGTYAVSENAFSGYSQSFSGDCDGSGSVTLSAGDNKTCTITNDDIAVPVVPPPTSLPATLHIIKHVVNNDGGTAVASSFTLHVKSTGSFGTNDVTGSPGAGAETPGTSYSLVAATYVVSENAFTGYASSTSGDCDASGNVTLVSGDNKTCTITNDDIAVPPPVVPPVVVPPVVVPPVVVPPSVSTPSVPNTGAGGNAPETLLTLALSAMVALGSAAYLRYRTH